MGLFRRHLRDEDLLDHYDGDGRAAPGVGEHLGGCPRCAAAYAALATDLRRLGNLRLDPAAAPGFWEAQAAAVERRLRASEAVRRPPGRWGLRFPSALRRRGPATAAALATAAVLAFVAWGPWRAPTPPPPSVVELDRLDDQMLREIDALLAAPLGSAGQPGWAGVAVPVLWNGS